MEKTIITDFLKTLPPSNMQQRRIAQKKFEEDQVKFAAIYAVLMEESTSTDTRKEERKNTTDGQSGESTTDKEDEADDIYLINKWKTEANLYKEFSSENNQAVSALRVASDLTFITSCKGWSSMFTLSTSKSDNDENTLTLLTRKHVVEYDKRREELQMLVENGSQLIDVIMNVCWKIIIP